MGGPHRHWIIATLTAAGLALAGAQARAQCGDDGDDGYALGEPGRGDLIRIGRGGALAVTGMRGCGIELESRIAGRKLSFVTADLEHAWDIENPLDEAGGRLRYSQAGIDLFRGSGLRWTVRASTAESLPEESDFERLAGAEATERQIGARGMAMTSILRTRDGRAEWLSEMAGAHNGVDQWGMATRQRLRATVLRGAGLRLDGILRHQRAEPAFDGPASVLERDRDTLAAGAALRWDQWTVAVDVYRSHDNLDQRLDDTRAWVGWTGTVRYRFAEAAGWRPSEVAVLLNRSELTKTDLTDGGEKGRRKDRVELKLGWPGPLLLRLESIDHTAFDGARETGTAREFALGAERGHRAGDWRWYAAGRVGHLVGDDGFDSESESRLTLRLGAATLSGPDLRLGLQAEVAHITPRGDDAETDGNVQLRANLRF